MRLNRFGSLVVTAIAWTPFAAMGNQLSNGGFEAPVLVAGTFITIQPGAEPPGFLWQVNPADIDLAHLPLPQFNINFNAFEGVQAADLNGNSSGGLRQDFSTIAGRTYTLSFAYADNPVSSAVATANVSVIDLINGNASLLNSGISHSSSSNNTADWTIFSQTFVAGSASSRLILTSTSVDTGASGGIFVDAVDVTQVPEPASALAALASCFAARRRPRRLGPSR